MGPSVPPPPPPLLFFAPWGLRSFCIQMVGLCATMKYGTICTRYIEALLWRKWVSYLCSRDVFFFFFVGLFLEPVYVFFVFLLPFCLRLVFLCYFANFLVSFILILDVFQSEMWTEFFAAIPTISSPWLVESRKPCSLPEPMALFALTWLVLDVGSFGRRLIVFATCPPTPFKFQFTCSA